VVEQARRLRIEHDRLHAVGSDEVPALGAVGRPSPVAVVDAEQHRHVLGDCPLEYVVGDGRYGRDRQYLHDLEFSWGVHPVFPLPSDISPAMPHAATRGVPACRHGLMKRRNHDGYINPDRRRELGIPRNRLVPDDARIRYVCPIGDPTCPKQTVYTRDDGRLYPYGLETDLYFARCQAQQLGRNSIEMRFAHLKGGGVANTGQARFKMRSDRATEWLISLNFLLATAKRLAHETGGYERALDDPPSLGLLDKPPKMLANTRIFGAVIPGLIPGMTPVGREGIEPSTLGLRGPCSAN
jgi:hypothetical protein